MYTIKQASQRSGVSVALLRAWERRYGIVSPTRTESGYRLYDEGAIERLRAMRILVDGGWSPRQAAERIGAADGGEIEEIVGSAGRVEAAEPFDPESSTRAFVDGAARIDGATIERALDDMFARGSFERVVEDRLYPALRALGEAWAAGSVDVAGEHAASAAAVRRLSMSFEAAGGSGATPPLLVGLPPGARHEIGSLAFATAARRAGLPVVYLGADVPSASWVAAVHATDARAVAIGVVTEGDVVAANAVVSALRDRHPRLTVAVGGRHREQVGDGAVVRLPEAVEEAVEALRAALA